MAPKFGSLKPKAVVHALQKAGFYIHETAGAHVQLKHPNKPGRVTVPYHQKFDLSKMIVKSIIRQAGMTNKEFLELLDE